MMKRDHFEFSTGFYQMQAVTLERIPAIHRACRPEYLLAEQAAHVDQPEETLLLRPSGGEWLHVGGSGAAAVNAQINTPQPFARCTIKNFGRLPMLDMHLPAHLSFTKPGSGTAVQSTFMIDLPGLSADAEYEFSLLNGSPDVMQIAFDRNVLLSAMDGNGQISQHLFVDARVSELERMHVEPAVADGGMAMGGHMMRMGSPSKTLVSITDFAYRPGRYVFRCAYHPYMRGEVDVR